MKIKNLHRRDFFLAETGKKRIKTGSEASRHYYKLFSRLKPWCCFKIHDDAGLFFFFVVCLILFRRSFASNKFARRRSSEKLNLITFHEKLNNYSQTAGRRIVHNESSSFWCLSQSDDDDEDSFLSPFVVFNLPTKQLGNFIYNWAMVGITKRFWC